MENKNVENKISFVVPCYNSKNTIEKVVNEIILTISNKYEYEIILVNDGSSDTTFSTIKTLAEKNKNIKVLNFSKNYGQHSAIIAGMRYSNGSILVCLDDDGQTPASDCQKLINAINEGYDVVYAKYDNKQHSQFRNFGSYLNDKMMCLLLNKPKELYISSFFACKNYIVKEIIKYINPYPYMQGLVLRSTNNITNIDVEHKKRFSGKSNYSLIKLFSLWMNGFTTFSVKPLRASSFFGFLFSFVGFVYGLILIVLKVLNKTQVLGYSSIMATILFIGGIIMISLGLIGEYLGRIYICINQSPQYVIKDTYNINDYEKCETKKD